MWRRDVSKLETYTATSEMEFSWKSSWCCPSQWFLSILHRLSRGKYENGEASSPPAVSGSHVGSMRHGLPLSKVNNSLTLRGFCLWRGPLIITSRMNGHDHRLFPMFCQETLNAEPVPLHNQYLVYVFCQPQYKKETISSMVEPLPFHASRLWPVPK